MNEREFATDVVRTLHDAGHEAFFAGGSVRDMLLGHKPEDFDVATSARPEQVQQLFRRTVAVGVSFGVVEVLGPKPHKVQVATFRSDGPYSDGRRPDTVIYSSPREDAERRDFTINGMFFDPIAGKLIDFVGGEADLKARVLRAIGDPAVRFTEDRLRLLRAVRMAARFEFAIDPTTFAAVQAMAAQVVTVSGERVAEELRKLLGHPHRSGGMALMIHSGLWPVIFPEMPRIDERIVVTLARLTGVQSFALNLAVLLGELPTRALSLIADRLRLSNSDRERMEWLAARREALVNADDLPNHQLKPLLAHPGIDELLELHHVFGHEKAVIFCRHRLAEWSYDMIDPPPLVTGDDLKAMGLTPGPQFKLILDAVRNAQLDEVVTTREAALAMARQFINQKP